MALFEEVVVLADVVDLGPELDDGAVGVEQHQVGFSRWQWRVDASNPWKLEFVVIVVNNKRATAATPKACMDTFENKLIKRRS